MPNSVQNLSADNISNNSEALIFLTEFTLASLEHLDDASRPNKNEIRRHIAIAQFGIQWIATEPRERYSPRVHEIISSKAMVHEWLGHTEYVPYATATGFNVFSLDAALAFMLDCTMATLSAEGCKTRPRKGEVRRLVDACQVALPWVKKIDHSAVYVPSRVKAICQEEGGAYAWAAKKYELDWLTPA